MFTKERNCSKVEVFFCSMDLYLEMRSLSPIFLSESATVFNNSLYLKVNTALAGSCLLGCLM